MIRAPSILLLLALTACASTPTVKYLRPDVPAALLTCEPRPDVPAEGSSMPTVAAFMLALDEAGEDCRSKVDTLRGLLSPNGKASLGKE